MYLLCSYYMKLRKLEAGVYTECVVDGVEYVHHRILEAGVEDGSGKFANATKADQLQRGIHQGEFEKYNNI